LNLKGKNISPYPAQIVSFGVNALNLKGKNIQDRAIAQQCGV